MKMKNKTKFLLLLLFIASATASLQADCLDMAEFLISNGASPEVVIHFLKICYGV